MDHYATEKGRMEERRGKGEVQQGRKDEQKKGRRRKGRDGKSFVPSFSDIFDPPLKPWM